MSLLLSNSTSNYKVSCNPNYDFSKGKDDLERLLKCKIANVKFLAGDGSDRTYYRVFDEKNTAVAVIMRVSDADNAAIIKGTYDWITICSLLQQNLLLSPKILGAVPSINALVIQDFGDCILEKFVESSNWETTGKIYKTAIDTIFQMISIQPNQKQIWSSRSFDQRKLSEELRFFEKHYLNKTLGLRLNADDKKLFDEEIIKLGQFLEDFSKYFVHRDFHSRNIIITQNKIGLIDFQDARLGPVSYDIVSLIFDPYVKFDFKNRLEFSGYFKALLKNKEMEYEFDATFKPMALQRGLKAIGSFGYLTSIKKRGDYLKYVPEALNCLLNLDVYDNRWPFISDTLIQKLKKLNHDHFSR